MTDIKYPINIGQMEGFVKSLPNCPEKEALIELIKVHRDNNKQTSESYVLTTKNTEQAKMFLNYQPGTYNYIALFQLINSAENLLNESDDFLRIMFNADSNSIRHQLKSIIKSTSRHIKNPSCENFDTKKRCCKKHLNNGAGKSEDVIGT